MSNYVQLQGTEQVQRAANTMIDAAYRIEQAASRFETQLFYFSRAMEDWLTRFESVLEADRNARLENKDTRECT